LPERLRVEIDRRQPDNYANFRRLMGDFLAAIAAPQEEMS